MSDRAHPQTDVRALRRREDQQLVVVVMTFLVVVGGAAIGVVYGWHTALQECRVAPGRRGGYRLAVADSVARRALGWT